MGQAGEFLRRQERGYAHWCEGCGETHVIFDNWQFNGDLVKPTFTPSVKISGKQAVLDERGNFTGEWRRGPDGRALDLCCHYFLTAGIVNFCPDCTHAFAGQSRPLPPLPEWLRDP